MSLPFALAIFFTIWWVVLFAVLPFGVHSQAESGEERTPGTDAGAPVVARMGMKIVATTIVAAIVFAGVYAFIAFEG